MNTSIVRVKKDASGCLYEEVEHTSVVVMPVEHYVPPLYAQRPELVSHKALEFSEPISWDSGGKAVEWRHMIEVTEVTVRKK